MSASERTRQALVAAAARVLVADRGAGIAEIAAAAGVVRTTVHRHFPSRDHLVKAVALDALRQTERALRDADLAAGTVGDAFLRAATALTPIGPQLAFLLSEASIEHDDEVRRRADQAVAPLTDLAGRGVAAGFLRAGLPPDWVVDAFVALLLAAHASVEDGRLAARHAPGLVVDTLLGGARAEAPPPDPAAGG